MDDRDPTLPQPANAAGGRHHGERRTHERRARPRGGFERRLSVRRRKQLGGLLMAAAALASPHHARKAPTSAWGKSLASNFRFAAEANVAVNIDAFRAAKPEDAYETLIQEAAATYDIPPSLIRAVMRTESAFNPNAVSRVGAKGLMQLMPALSQDMGVTDPFDPRQNIMAGAKYLRKLLDVHSGNVRLTLASYNAGPGNVRRYKGIPPFKETRNYVKKITGLLAEEAAAAETQE
ncbi:MAG TPA: lytic transglycosylase domain-containing protein [Thermoanaerobaculia bacterium]|nr:lytic transglycosylase domain-containing protein [Thermoanaerobaculia bacterium]